MAVLARTAALRAEQVTVVLLAFEGPDSYSRAGGLAVRVSELSRALAEQGATVHLLFVGDPDLPGHEESLEGHLTLHRWCQWISGFHPGGVYDGEDGKVADYTASAPWFVVEHLVRPALERGHLPVIMAEEWQTSEAVCRIDDLLRGFGIRQETVLLWNANNTMGFQRINWPRLQTAAAVTTVSRYMKHLLWGFGVNPLVIPNGIPQDHLNEVDAAQTDAVRRGLGEQPSLVKVARWDPDKRWLLAMEALARLKAHDRPAVLVARGGVEAHGGEVMHHAAQLGLSIRDISIESGASGDPGEYAAAFAQAGSAEVLNVTNPIPQPVLRVLYRAADGVLANSGREPFGLVGLEAMAAGGTAYTGNTGEEYVRHLRNAVVLDTEDPDEAAWYVRFMAERPNQQAALRAEARTTAKQFAWDCVSQDLLTKIAFLSSRWLVADDG